MVTPKRQAKLERRQEQILPGVVVVLENIVDPHNAAAIVRTCDGLGIGTVYYLFDSVEPYDPRTIGKRSSSTANKWVDLEVFTDRAALQVHLVAEGYASIATVVDGAGVERLWETDLAVDRLALWVGNETTGLSAAAQQFCTRHLTIPMRGMVESFNVSVAAALVLSEIARQRRS